MINIWIILIALSPSIHSALKWMEWLKTDPEIHYSLASHPKQRFITIHRLTHIIFRVRLYTFMLTTGFHGPRLLLDLSSPFLASIDLRPKNNRAPEYVALLGTILGERTP